MRSCPPVAADELFAAGGSAPALATVVVTVHDYAGFVGEALDSVAAQDLAALDLVVVDDASRDGSRRVVAEWLALHACRFAAARLVAHRVNAGPAAARDSGFRLCRTPAALILDADNRLYPRCVGRCLEALDASGAAFAYPLLRCFGDAENIRNTVPFTRSRLARGNCVDILALIRRSVWETLGGFPHVDDGFEDWALWLRCLELGLDGVLVPEILAEYRVHPGSRTAQRVTKRLPELAARFRAAFPWLEA